MRPAHEVAGDEHEAVDADLAPAAEQQQKQGGKGHGADFVDYLHQAGVDYIVMGNDGKHDDDPI